MPERIQAILNKVVAWWKKFNPKQRSLMISAVAVVIVALVILAVVLSRPTKVELVEAESASDASSIKGVLEDNNITYDVDSDLVFYVNKSDEVNAIMALGDNGIPAQAYSIDNVTDGSFSTTEADKQKKYQVYLEDKLKDHLEKQKYIEEASVDITMPDKDGTILKSDEEATAAVTLGLKDSISDDQALRLLIKRQMFCIPVEMPNRRQELRHPSCHTSRSLRSRLSQRSRKPLKNQMFFQALRLA